MLFLVVATAFAANCADKAFTLDTGYAYGVKTAKKADTAATCTDGAFKAMTAGAAAVMNDAASVQAALKDKDLNGKAFPGGAVKCASGYTGAAKAKCEAEKLSATGCTKIVAPTLVACKASAKGSVYDAVAAGQKPGTTADVKCTIANPMTANGKSKCVGATTAAAVQLSGCVAASFTVANCPVPACGAKESKLKYACNGAKCTGTAPADVTCAAEPSSCTAKTCDAKDLFAASKKKDAASCAKTAKKALGDKLAGCTCTASCNTGKTRNGKNYTCKTTAETSAAWSCPMKTTGGGAGSSASGVSMIAAAVFGVLSYAL